MNFVSMLPPDIVFPLQSLEDRLLEAVRGGEMPRDPVNFAPRFVNQGLPQDTSRPLFDVPVLRGARRAAILQGKTNHCPRSEWLIRRRIGFGSLLTVEPRE